MNVHNSDFALIGLTTARIASQLREGINLSVTSSFGTELGTYCIISIFNKEECLISFHLTECEGARDMLDKVFAYCLEKNLFKIPMDITLVD